MECITYPHDGSSGQLLLAEASACGWMSAADQHFSEWNRRPKAVFCVFKCTRLNRGRTGGTCLRISSFSLALLMTWPGCVVTKATNPWLVIIYSFCFTPWTTFGSHSHILLAFCLLTYNCSSFEPRLYELWNTRVVGSPHLCYCFQLKNTILNDHPFFCDFYVNSGNPITVTLPAEVADARRALWSLHKS